MSIRLHALVRPTHLSGRHRIRKQSTSSIRRTLLLTPEWVRVVCLMLWLAPLACGAAQGSGESDGWPRYAHDPALTARSPLHGNITRPQTRWSYSVAGRELLVEILPAKGEHPMRFVAKDAATVSREPKVPRPGPSVLDLDGSGTLRPAPESY